MDRTNTLCLGETQTNKQNWGNKPQTEPPSTAARLEVDEVDKFWVKKKGFPTNSGSSSTAAQKNVQRKTEEQIWTQVKENRKQQQIIHKYLFQYILEELDCGVCKKE